MHRALASDRIIAGSLWRGMLRFFIPIMLGTLLQQLYNMADTVIVSFYVGKDALAAVGGSAASIVSLLVNFFVALSSGASVVIAQHYGGGRKEQVRTGIQTALVLAVICGAVLTVVGILAARPLLEALHTKEGDIMRYSVDYLTYYFLGMIPSMLYNMGSSIIRSMGDSKRPLQFLAVSTAANVVLDLLFVVGFGMEVAGAAIATTISQVISAALVLRYMIRMPQEVRPSLRRPKISREMLGRMLQIGLPSGFQSAMYNVANLLVQTAVNSMSNDVVAGWAAFRKIDDIYWPISSAIGITVMTFVGQNYGAQRHQRVKKTIYTGLKMHLAITCIFSLLICLARHPLIGLFAKGDDAVLRAGMTVIIYTAPFYLLFGCTEIMAATMRAVGNAVKPTIITMCCVCVLRVVYLWVYGFAHVSIFTVAVIFPVSWGVSSLTFLVYFLSRRWMPPLMRRQWEERKRLVVHHSHHPHG